MAQAFDGVRIIDFTQVLAGPFATRQLALQTGPKAGAPAYDGAIQADSGAADRQQLCHGGRPHERAGAEGAAGGRTVPGHRPRGCAQRCQIRPEEALIEIGFSGAEIARFREAKVI